MTTGPTDGECGNPAGGPGGMPLALRLNEGLGFFTRDHTAANISFLRDSIAKEYVAGLRAELA